MTDERVKPVLNMLTGYEPNHETHPFFINEAIDGTARLEKRYCCHSRSQIPRELQQTSNIVRKIHEGTQRRLC